MRSGALCAPCSTHRGAAPMRRVSASRIAQVGLVARGIVFAMIGWFLVQAARTVDPKQVIGLDGALAKLAHEPAGPFLLGGVALGLIAFGIYSIFCARWIKIRPGQ